MTLAVGKLADVESGRALGTVFAVSHRLALTAFHCVGDRDGILVPRARCAWLTGTSNVAVLDYDTSNDVALLQLERPLPKGLEPILLSPDVGRHERFAAPGAPGELAELPLAAMSGEIIWPEGWLPDGAPGIQLICTESAAGLSLHGLSGAPVLTGEPPKAVGLIRWNPPRTDTPGLAAGSIVYAAPSALIMQRWSQLTSGPGLTDLFRRLADRGRARTLAVLATDLKAVLVSGGLGLDEQDLNVILTAGDEKNPMIAIDSGQAVIRVVRNFNVETVTAIAAQELADAIATRNDHTKQRYVGLLTDGAEWRLYQWVHGTLDLADTQRTNPRAPGELLGWLEAILASGQGIPPSRFEIERKLGSSSPSYKLDAMELTALYKQHRNVPTVKVKRHMWAKLLTTASGISFTDDDTLFIDHTLLVVMAKLIGHAVLNIPMTGPQITAASFMSGERFADAEIWGVIESDFFDWIIEIPKGEQFVLDLARRLTRFDWSHVEHDVLKHLYESIIPRTTRHQLGEYYTPDWLAEKIIVDTVPKPLDQRVLDASCGSGTFLFHAVRSYLAAAEASGVANAEAIRGLVRSVIGIDVHPVAVTLARVTYLLAIDSRRLKNHPAFTVPVYLGDSMRWGQESELTLGTYEGLSIPTRMDPESFVTGPAPVGLSEFSTQLNFPDRVVADAERFDQLVAALAKLATKQRPEAIRRALHAIFRRFCVHDDDIADLEQTFINMRELHDQGRDHIWGYYVRNVARPTWLTRPSNRVDVLIGNPPWLVQRYMTKPQQKSFRTMSTKRGLWAGGTLATNQDLAGLFVARCIELYLRPGGRFGYVMPRAVLAMERNDSKGTYSGFRTGNYPVSAESVKVAFGKAWDLYGIKPSFFPLPPSVVFGYRQEHNMPATPLPWIREEWFGRFDTQYASWKEAVPHIHRRTAEVAPSLANGTSPYQGRFIQGANVVPRFLFIVDTNDPGSLGTHADRVPVRSRRSNNEKEPWKNLPDMYGAVERQFLLPLYSGECIMPFRCLDSSITAVIPWDGVSVLPEDPECLEIYQGLANWWRAAEEVWDRHRKNVGFSLLSQLDYRRKLSKQLSTTGYRVVYSGSAMYMAAAIISDPNVIIEHQLYWGITSGLDEARYLTAILNSTTVTMAVRHLQKRGEHNPRHIGKTVFKLPISIYNPDDAAHAQLVALAQRAERIASATDLPSTRFELQRKRVREALERDGVAADIDAIVKTLFDSAV